MRSSSKTAAGALLGALLTVALTGCASVVSGPDPEPTATAAPSVTAPPEPVQTPEPDPVPTPGEVIDASDKSSVPDGLVAYPLEGRDYLVLDPAAPLPQQVIDDMTARAAQTHRSAMPGLAGRLSEQTGKGVVIVLRSFGALADDESGDVYDVWQCYTSAGPLPPGHRSEAEAIAHAEAFVASQPDPGNWTILVP